VSLVAAVAIVLLYRYLKRTAGRFTRWDAALAGAGVSTAVAFGLLGERVLRQRSLGMDRSLDAIADGLAPLVPLAKVLTLLGSATFILPAAALTCAWLVWEKRRWHAALVGIAVLGQQFVVETLKLTFHRARPPGGVVSSIGHSFPSGHTAAIVVFVGVLSYVLLRSQPRTRRIGLSLAGIVLSVGVGLSRVVLRVHYPSDVLGGILAGTCWLAVMLLIGEWIEKGPVAEAPVPAPTRRASPPLKP
jgi:undecaprenyl-diphosphatase